MGEPPDAIDRAIVAATPAHEFVMFHPRPMMASVLMSRRTCGPLLKSRSATEPSSLVAAVAKISLEKRVPIVRFVLTMLKIFEI